MQAPAQMCYWCAYPIEGRGVNIINDRVKLRCCNGSCAMAYMKTYHRLLTPNWYIDDILEELGLTMDAIIPHAPNPQPYCWWSPGGKSRAEFLEGCVVTYPERARGPARSSSVKRIRNPNLRSLIDSCFESITAIPKPPRKRRRLKVKKI